MMLTAAQTWVEAVAHGNFAVSPASISATLAMAGLGASGRTGAQMRAVLGLDPSEVDAWAGLLQSLRLWRAFVGDGGHRRRGDA